MFDSQGSIINSCVCALLGLSIAFTVSWRLSLALLGALPLLGAAEGAQQTLMISGEKNIGKALNASAEIVNESVKSAKEIQAFGLQSVVSRHLLWCCDNDFVLLGITYCWLFSKNISRTHEPNIFFLFFFDVHHRCTNITRTCCSSRPRHERKQRLPPVSRWVLSNS